MSVGGPKWPTYRFSAKIPGGRDVLGRKSPSKKRIVSSVFNLSRTAVLVGPGPRELYLGTQLGIYLAKHPEIMKAGISCIGWQDCKALKEILGDGAERVTSMGQTFLFQQLLEKLVPGVPPSIIKDLVPAFSDKLSRSELDFIKSDIRKPDKRARKTANASIFSSSSKIRKNPLLKRTRVRLT